MMKEEKLSQQSKRELVEAVRGRYLRAVRKEKSKILDEFVAITGFHRKHAIRVLRQGYQRGRERRPTTDLQRHGDQRPGRNMAHLRLYLWQKAPTISTGNG
jgi:hypothetical protein